MDEDDQKEAEEPEVCDFCQGTGKIYDLASRSEVMCIACLE